MAKQMQIQINGKKEEVQVQTVLDLLRTKEIDPRMVAVELNSHILERETLETAQIKEGDHVELLFYMGGGR